MMMPERNLTIEIHGAIGAGKSTMSAILAKMLGSLGFEVEASDKADLPGGWEDIIADVNARIPAKVVIVTKSPEAAPDV